MSEREAHIDKVAQYVKEIVEEQCGELPRNYDPNCLFKEIEDLDSLTMLEVIAETEKRTNIFLSDEDVAKFTRPSDLIYTIERELKKRCGGLGQLK